VSIILTPFRHGRAQASVPHSEDTLRELCSDADTLVWVAVDEPGVDDFAMLQRALGLPELAVESAREGRQRPKLDTYDDCALIVAYAALVKNHSSRRRLRLTELSLFMGRGYMMTVRSDATPQDDALRHRLTSTEGRPLRSSTALVHAALDSIVDDYFGVTEDIDQRIEAIDRQAYEGLDNAQLARAFALRRDLVRLRRVVGPLREVLNGMVRREGGVLDDSVDEHLRDLYDHVITVYEDLEMARDLLAGDLEAHLSAVSNRMNSIVLKVSAWAAIIAVPTVIASIYGMNFKNMPELGWSIGYPGALLLMAFAAVALYLAFKRQHWL
jgi:magnesium transporter